MYDDNYDYPLQRWFTGLCLTGPTTALRIQIRKIFKIYYMKEFETCFARQQHRRRAKRFQETSPASQKPQAVACLLQGLFCALSHERVNVGCEHAGSRKDETCEKRMAAFNFQPCS